MDPSGRFAGYPFIAGDELTPRRFAFLPAEVRRRVLDQAGRFLAALHGLAPATVLPSGRWPTIPSVAAQAAHARAHYVPRIARAWPKLAGLIDAFYDDDASDVTHRRVILHGDLVDDHILLAKDGQGLAGIIDFSDVALGDPARDLLGFWAYGADAVARVIAAYGADADDGLHARSRRAFVRYRIDRFAELLAAGGEGAAEQALPDLIALLSASDRSPVGGAHFSRPDDTIQRR